MKETIIECISKSLLCNETLLEYIAGCFLGSQAIMAPHLKPGQVLHANDF